MSVVSCAESTKKKKFASDIVKKSENGDDAFNDDTTVIHGKREEKRHIKKVSKLTTFKLECAKKKCSKS